MNFLIALLATSLSACAFGQSPIIYGPNNTAKNLQQNILTQRINYVETGGGTDTVTVQPPAALAASYTLTLPADDGILGQILSTNGSGVMSWIAAGTGDIVGPASSTDNAVARFDGATGKLVQNSTVLISDTGDITAAKSLSVSGTAGAGFIDLLENNPEPATPASTHIRLYNFGYALGILNEDGNSAVLDTANLTADRNFGLPDASGTLALTTSFPSSVQGPASSTDNALTRFDGTTGKLVQNSVATLSDAGDLSLPTTTVTNVGGSRYLHSTAGLTNVYLGSDAANLTATATSNTGVGASSLSAVTSGSLNTAVGRQAGNTITDGSSNVTVGYQSAVTSPSGIEGIAIGNTAKAGSKSVVIGQAAGTAQTGLGFIYSVLIGARAGDGITSGTGNTFIGADADVGSGGGAVGNAFAIGADATATASNQGVLGNNVMTEFLLGSDDTTTAASAARTIRSGNAFGLNQNAGTLTLQGSRSTGTGTGGDISFKTVAPSASSSTLNTPTEQVLITAANGTKIRGTTTNDAAAAGFVGENIASNSASVSITCGSPVNVASLASLGAGDWEIQGVISITPGTATVITGFIGGISTSSAAFDATNIVGYVHLGVGALDATANQSEFPTGARRISLSAATPVYLVGRLNCTTAGTGTFSNGSQIRARRIR